MKKIILTIIALTFSAIANAEYLVMIPLEANEGGSLPNGSISFTSESTPAEPEAPVDPVENYFNNNLVATIDYVLINMARTNNSASISSSQHSSLTKRIDYNYSFGAANFSVAVGCGDCRSKLPASISLVVDGTTYAGTSCSTGFTPYNEALTLSDYTSISCRITSPSSLMSMGKNYQIIFNK